MVEDGPRLTPEVCVQLTPRTGDGQGCSMCVECSHSTLRWTERAGRANAYSRLVSLDCVCCAGGVGVEGQRGGRTCASNLLADSTDAVRGHNVVDGAGRIRLLIERLLRGVGSKGSTCRWRWFLGLGESLT